MEGAVQPPGLQGEEDTALATRAAWLYYAGGLTQSEVADRLGLALAKAHRLIARATKAGLVRVFVEGPIGGCIALEETLAARYGLATCRVVPPLDEAGLPLRALGTAAASVLREALERGRHRVIGLGHGRTLAAAVDVLPRIPAPSVRLVSLLGGLPRRISSGPFDVIHRAAEKTGAEAFLLPVPMIANSPTDADVLRRQRGVAETLALAAEATLVFAGIGAVGEAAFLPMAGMLEAGEVRALRAAGAAGEMLGRYFAADGTLIATDLHDRVIATHPSALRGVVAVAGGAEKTSAIQAVLSSRILAGLITDELTARRLAAEPA
ncbi:MAG: winged helix-turn-helix transcriptional regulator [Rhodospirillales bacterium]|nr:winged helix-turn-helix transcriptional regulator [Rhodospirillales bacterium]